MEISFQSWTEGQARGMYMYQDGALACRTGTVSQSIALQHGGTSQ